MAVVREKIVPLSVPTPFIVGPVNCLLYRGEALTLLDVGPKTEDAWEALHAGLAAEGVALADIERVILTHHHIDHCGMLKRVVEASGAETWAHPDLVNQSRLGDGEDGDGERKNYYYRLMAQLGVPEDEAERSMLLWDAYKDMIDRFEIDHDLPDGARVDGFTTYHVPGHSATDTIFVHEEGFSVTGDHILETMNPNPLLRRPNPGEQRAPALVEFRASLRRSRELPLGRVYPGHGKPIEDPVRVIDGLLAQHERKNERIMGLLPHDGITPYALARELYPQLEMPHLYLGLSVAVGQLEVLADEGRVREVVEEDGRLRYLRA